MQHNYDFLNKELNKGDDVIFICKDALIHGTIESLYSNHVAITTTQGERYLKGYKQIIKFSIEIE